MKTGTFFLEPTVLLQLTDEPTPSTVNLLLQLTDEPTSSTD